MAGVLETLENVCLMVELQEKVEKKYPCLHRQEDREEYLAAVIEVAAAEIQELQAKAKPLRPSYGIGILAAMVPRAAYDAQTRECLIKTGVIQQLVKENGHLVSVNEVQGWTIDGLSRLLQAR